jgi:hypothetical protein
VAREREVGRWVGAVGILACLAFMVSFGFANQASPSSGFASSASGDEERVRRLVDYAAHTGEQALAAGLQALGLLASAAVAVYLFWLIRHRDDAVRPRVLGLAVAGMVIFGISAVLAHVALKDVADTFAASGPRTSDRAENLVDDSAVFQVAQVLDILGRIVFAVGLGLLSRAAMRVDLLTGFLATWGIFAGITLVLGVVGLAVGLPMFIGWLASVVLLVLGYWPGGRPDGWTARTAPAGA